MNTLGLEISDAGLGAALAVPGDAPPRPLVVPDRQGADDWPGFCHSDGRQLLLGRAAEDLWFVHPRRVDHHFWSRLGHEPSALPLHGKTASSSEIAFHFLREFWSRLPAGNGRADRVVLAVPGAYFRDPAAEEEKIGLLLGMAHELKLPLVAVVESAVAALGDPRGPGCDPRVPTLVVDAGLAGADLTVFHEEGGRLVRAAHAHLPQAGLAGLWRHLTATLGNRFLRQTAFDILADSRIEQTFFRQVKEFTGSEAPEHRFAINTPARTYEMTTKREQLAADAQGVVLTILQGVQEVLGRSPGRPTPGTVALTERAARVPGLEARLLGALHTRVVRLPATAAAAGAAFLHRHGGAAPTDLAEVPVETHAAAADICRPAGQGWHVAVRRPAGPAGTEIPTHAVIRGLAHPLPRRPRIRLGPAGPGIDVPATLFAGEPQGDGALELHWDQGRWWLPGAAAAAGNLPLGAGDQLVVSRGDQHAEVLLVRCLTPAGDPA